MNSQSQNDSHISTWELLGELELPLGDGQNQVIHEWLNPTLEPLKLHEDTLRRVETSLQEVAMRAVETHTKENNRHVHFRIYWPILRASKSETWGFFRVDKFEQQGDGMLPSHSTELYLYLEVH